MSRVIPFDSDEDSSEFEMVGSHPDGYFDEYYYEPPIPVYQNRPRSSRRGSGESFSDDFWTSAGGYHDDDDTHKVTQAQDDELHWYLVEKERAEQESRMIDLAIQKSLEADENDKSGTPSNKGMDWAPLDISPKEREMQLRKEEQRLREELERERRGKERIDGGRRDSRSSRSSRDRRVSPGPRRHRTIPEVHNPIYEYASSHTGRTGPRYRTTPRSMTMPMRESDNERDSKGRISAQRQPVYERFHRSQTVPDIRTANFVREPSVSPGYSGSPSPPPRQTRQEPEISPSPGFRHVQPVQVPLEDSRNFYQHDYPDYNDGPKTLPRPRRSNRGNEHHHPIVRTNSDLGPLPHTSQPPYNQGPPQRSFSMNLPSIPFMPTDLPNQTRSPHSAAAPAPARERFESVHRLPAPLSSPPIKLIDPTGRVVSFPYKQARSWSRMIQLIKGACGYLEGIGPTIMAEAFQVVGPDHRVLSGDDWEDSVRPGMEVSLRIPEVERVGGRKSVGGRW